DELANEIGLPVGLSGFVNRHDARMPELGHAAGFAEKPVGVFLAAQIAGARNFNRHGSVQLWIAGLVNRAESADADDVQKLELSQVALAGAQARALGRPSFQPEARSTRRAKNFCRRRIFHHFNRILTMRTNEVHGFDSSVWIYRSTFATQECVAHSLWSGVNP